MIDDNEIDHRLAARDAAERFVLEMMKEPEGTFGRKRVTVEEMSTTATAEGIANADLQYALNILGVRKLKQGDEKFYMNGPFTIAEITPEIQPCEQ